MLKKRKKRRGVFIMMILCAALTIAPSFVFAAGEAEGASQGQTAAAESGDASQDQAPAAVIKDPAKEEGQAEEAADAAQDQADEAEAGESSQDQAAAPEEKGASQDGASAEEEKEGSSPDAAGGAGPAKVKNAPAALKAGAKAAAGISNGKKIEYTSKIVGKVDQTTIFTYKDTDRKLTFKGTCREAGMPSEKSGTGTVESRISNSSKIAKVLYKYAIQKGWFTGSSATTNARKVLGLNYKVGFTYRRLVEAACQISNMGKADFKKAMMEVGGVSEPTVNAIYNWYHDLDVSNVTVPDEFEAYLVTTPKGVQSFTMWVLKETTDEETGFASVKKVSADESITGPAPDAD